MKTVASIFIHFLGKPFMGDTGRFETFAKGIAKYVSEDKAELEKYCERVKEFLNQWEKDAFMELANFAKAKYYGKKDSKGQDHKLWQDSMTETLQERGITDFKTQYILSRLIQAENNNMEKARKEEEAELQKELQSETEEKLIIKRAREIATSVGTDHPTDEMLDIYEDNYQRVPNPVRNFLTSGGLADLEQSPAA
jgi:hypothetical protein